MRSASVPTPAAHSATIQGKAGLAGDAREDSIEASAPAATGNAVAAASASAPAPAALPASPANHSLAKVSAGSNAQASRAPQATA